MKQARNEMIKTMVRHNEGKTTNNAADAMHKLGYSVAMNQFAEVRASDATSDREQAEMLNKAQDGIMDL